MKIELRVARRGYPRLWEMYKILRAEQGFCHWDSFIMSGRRAWVLRVGRVELILADLWHVDSFDVREPDDR